MPNSNNIIVAAPEQSKTTGAIYSAPVGTTVPTTAAAALDEAFTSGGYVSEDGVSLAQSVSTTSIKEWGGAIVRKILTEYDGTISWSFLEFADEESLKQMFGTDYVTKGSDGEITVKLGSHLPEARAWVFNMKDGARAVRIVVPNGQITETSDMTFNVTDAVKPAVTLSCYDDGTGNSIYVIIGKEVVSA